MNTQNELVSVIIPNYNSEKFIRDTVQSVLRQTYENIELIIVDDCSTDNSYKILQELANFDDRICLYKLNENSGRPAVPRNFALKQSKGRYIAFLDADDIWHKQKIEIQLYFLKKYNMNFISTQKSNFIDEAPIDVNIKDFEKLKYEIITHERLIQKNNIVNSSVLLRRDEIINKTFNENMKYKAIEDYIMWLRIHEKIQSMKINYPLVYYRISDSSISKNKIQMAKKILKFLLEYKHENNKHIIKLFNFYLYIYRSIFKNEF